MMLSIRSLAFNDPLSTQRLKFSTILFENRDHAEGAEIPRGVEIEIIEGRADAVDRGL